MAERREVSGWIIAVKFCLDAKLLFGSKVRTGLGESKILWRTPMRREQNGKREKGACRTPLGEGGIVSTLSTRDDDRAARRRFG